MKEKYNSLDELERSEYDETVPLLDGDEIKCLFAHLDPFVKEEKYGKLTLALDFEQLQIVHYPSLFSSKPEVAELLETIQNSGMYKQIELNFLSLRSLVTLIWTQPESNEHLEYMVKIENALYDTMLRFSNYIIERHPDRETWLPYWARLVQFNLLRELPQQIQQDFGPDGTPCIMLRSCDINAHTFPITTGQAIVLDFALEPFLKDMNRFLMSYFDSRNMAGAMRIPRAFKELLPRVLFFKGLVPAHKQPPFSILLSNSSYQSVKSFTFEQISFLVAHEIGHILLQHPSSRAALPKPQNTEHLIDIHYLEHEHIYEHEADIFALDCMMSKVINSFRYYLHPKRTEDPDKVSTTIETLREKINDYGTFYTSVETLFIIINFIEKFYDNLIKATSEVHVPFQFPSHPTASVRWKRLQKHSICDFPPISSEFNRYSEILLNDVLNYMSTLAKEEISKLIKEIQPNEGTN